MIVLRPATADDAEALSTVAAQTFHDGWAAIISTASANAYAAAHLTPERLRAEIANPDQHILLALDSDTNALFGYVRTDWARPPHESVPACDPVCLQRLYVIAAARGQGVADTLLNAATTDASTHGKDAIWLECEPRNARAWHYYEKHGFVETGKTVYHYPDGVNDNIRILVKRISTS